jgi:hypothetical protein
LANVFRGWHFFRGLRAHLWIRLGGKCISGAVPNAVVGSSYDL